MNLALQIVATDAKFEVWSSLCFYPTQLFYPTRQLLYQYYKQAHVNYTTLKLYKRKANMSFSF